MTDSGQVLKIIGAIGRTVNEQRDYLTKLDQPIGDSDHGINLDRGFQAVAQKLPGMEGKDIGTILKDVGMTLVSTVGGASGPLYGSAFMKAGAAAAGKRGIDADGFLELLNAAVEAVMKRGHATVEEATMLDAMVPSLEAMRKARADNASAKEMLCAGVEAAFQGAAHTKDLVATKGRASYVGERGLGHQDPGATSYAYMLKTIADCVQP